MELRYKVPAEDAITAEEQKKQARWQIFEDCFARLSDQKFTILKERFFAYIESEDQEKTPFSREHVLELLPCQHFRSAFRHCLYSSGNYWEEDSRAILVDLIVQETEQTLGVLAESWLPGLRLSAVSSLSGEVYESARASGQKMVIFPSEEAFLSCSNIIAFHQNNRLPLDSQKAHALRKQLNICRKGTALAVARVGYTYVTLGVASSSALEQYPSIQFLDHLLWELHLPSKLGKTHCLVRFVNGRPCVPRLTLTEEYKEFACKLFNDDIAAKRIANILTGFEARDGATLVFSLPEVMHRECERLAISAHRGIPFTSGEIYALLDHEDFNKKRMEQFTSIDGAVLLDTQGQCHAFGVILDGIAEEGTADRGARYNSICSYQKHFQSLYPASPLLCAVYSEDGMIDIFPSN